MKSSLRPKARPHGLEAAIRRSLIKVDRSIDKKMNADNLPHSKAAAKKKKLVKEIFGSLG